MKPSIRSAALLGALGLAGAIALPGSPALAQQPAAGTPATVTSVTEATATVETIDRTTRQVLLSADNGRLLTMVAGPEVRNLDQVKPGDKVHARFETELAASIAKPGQPPLTDRDVVSSSRAVRGQRPAGMDVSEIHRTVTVEAIDLNRNTVSFTGADRISHTVLVRTPQMQAFLRTLKVGDTVDVVYRESAMVAVSPAS